VDEALLLAPSFRSALSPFLARVPRRVGFSSDGRTVLLTEPVAMGGRDQHLAKQFLHLAARLGADASGSLDPRLPVGADEEQAASERLASGGLEARRTLAFCPGATYGETKRWPAGHWVDLGRMLSGLGWSIAVLGGQEERELGEQLAARIGRKAWSFAGRLDLRSSLSLLGRLAGAVSNDSGLLHLAVAAGCPVLGLFGSTNPSWTGPLGDASAVARIDLDCSPCYAKRCPTGIECLQDLRPETVQSSLLSLLRPGQRREE
jgi:heptosyltransferase-2